MPTLMDVARAAGVSRSTVSNVFNNPELVRPKVRQRVEAAARTLGFAGPDPKGRLLRAGKVNAIGIVPTGGWGVTECVTNPTFRLIMHGAAEACDEVGANLIVMSDVGKNGGGVRTALLDGFILSRIEHVKEIEAARLRRLPFAVLDEDAGPDVSSVRADARAGCRDAARHLIGLGHRRFAIMSFLRSFGSAIYHPPAPDRAIDIAGAPLDQEKFRGYADALAEAGIAIDDVPVVQAHPWDRDAAPLLLDNGPDATAVLSMADMQAIAVMEEARRRGRSVPRDLSVIGYNDIPEAAAANPPLTTIDGMGREKGRVAARIVFGGGPPRQELLPARLVLRASTAPAPA
jgi:DNA-binding LacI/PurR family transcriptional regulator